MKFHTKLAASVLLGTMIGLSSVAQAKDSTKPIVIPCARRFAGCI
jgi:hypothetical protein